MDSLHITVDREILGGTPVFAGTRVPIRVFFLNTSKRATRWKYFCKTSRR